jgi:RNA polymerase sigma-32 factor
MIHKSKKGGVVAEMVNNVDDTHLDTSSNDIDAEDDIEDATISMNDRKGSGRLVHSSQKFLTAKEEEVALLECVGEDQNKASRAQSLIIASHMSIVTSMAWKYIGYGLPADDLIQEGVIGLIKAIPNFKSDANVRFGSYAKLWVKSEMMNYILNNWHIVRLATSKPQRKLFFNLRRIKKSLDTLKAADVANIATQLNVSQEDVRLMEVRLSGVGVTSSSKEAHMPVPDVASLESNTRSFIDEMIYKANMLTLRESVDRLPYREKLIITDRWLRDDPRTLEDLAEEVGVSAERVRQLEKKCLSKIKKDMEVNGYENELTMCM